MSFQETILEIAPWFLRNRIAGTILEALGITADEAIETLALGIRAANPLTCKADALPRICEDRKIRWYPTEPESSIRVRLANYRQARKLAGSHQGEMRQLQPYFLPAGMPRIRIVHQDGLGASATWHTLEPDGRYLVHRSTPSNWNWDGVPLRWSRFWVIIYTHDLGLVESINYDDGSTYNAGHLWDGKLSAAQIADVVSIVMDWKAAHSRLWGVILTNDPSAFDPTGSGSSFPDGKWGYYIDNETGLPTRIQSATYAYDLGQAAPYELV